MIRPEVDGGGGFAIFDSFPEASIGKDVIDLAWYCIWPGESSKLVGLFFEECVDDGQPLHGSPFLKPLAAHVEWF